MGKRKILAVIAALAITAGAAWAADGTPAATNQAKKQLKAGQAPAKKVERPRVQPGSAQYRALDKATKQESGKFDTLSKASRERHDKAQNAVRNER